MQDLIVIGRSRKPSWQQRLFGSQTYQVAQHVPCAVMILPTTSSIQRLPDQKVAKSSVNRSHRADLQSVRSIGDRYTPFAWTQYGINSRATTSS